MSQDENPILKTSYWITLSAIGLWVLISFLTPSTRHLGLNAYEETRFPKMVQGTAYKPFVARTILPSTVRVLILITPSALEDKVDLFTKRASFPKQVFHRFGWGFENTLQYYFAALLMWACFVGFAHFTVLLTCRQVQWDAWVVWRTALGVTALLGLPAMFKYSSFPYDPSQLFLFTLALHLLATEKMRWFLLVFLLCCLSKETALLLIPIHAAFRWSRAPVQVLCREWAFLIISFAVIKGGLTWVFWHNPGSFVEMHLLDHNLGWLLHNWKWSELIVIVSLAVLVIFRWKRKPRFLRIAFLGTLPVLVGSGIIYGYIDEWRIYYEAYPIVFALVVASLRPLQQNTNTPVLRGDNP